jgi:hypothetical protein
MKQRFLEPKKEEENANKENGQNPNGTKLESDLLQKRTSETLEPLENQSKN